MVSTIKEDKRVSSLFIDLDYFKTIHYSNDKTYNKKLADQIKDIKLRVLKNGLDTTLKELDFVHRLSIFN